MLIPRQEVLTPMPERSAGSAGALFQASSISPQSQERSAGTHSKAGTTNPLSWEGVQALFPRQVALVLPKPGRSAASAGAHFQADSTNINPRMSAGNAGTPSQAGSSTPSQEGVQAVQVLFPK